MRYLFLFPLPALGSLDKALLQCNVLVSLYIKMSDGKKSYGIFYAAVHLI